jgi:peptide/nickel transport system substrate-binding protein
VLVVVAGAYFVFFPPEDPAVMQWRETLTFANSFDMVTIDPMGNLATTGLHTVRNCYEGLVKYEGSTASIVPSLATDWEISPDGLQYTFTLREDVKFHDGTPFNATAVKTSFERRLAITKGFYTFFTPIESVDVVDEFTARINLKHKFGPLLAVLGGVYGRIIITPTALEEHATPSDPWAESWFDEHTAGTGPYMMTEWIHEQSFTHSHFPDYWRGWEGDHIKTIIHEIVREATSQKLLLEQGDIDMIEFALIDDLAALNATEGITATVFKQFAIKTFFVWMYQDREPFDDPLVREAVGLAVDYETIWNDIQQNTVIPARGPLPPSYAEFNDDIPVPQQDLEAAKDLIRQAGHDPDEIWTTVEYIWVVGLDDWRQMGEVLQDNLRRIGIQVEIREITGAVWSNVKDDPELMPELFPHWTVAWYGNADGHLYTLYHTSSIPPAGSNMGRMRIAQVDALLDEARSETDQSRRTQLYRQVQDIVWENNPAVFVMNFGEMWVRHDYIQGHIFNPYYSRTYEYYDLYKVGPPPS